MLVDGLTRVDQFARVVSNGRVPLLEHLHRGIQRLPGRRARRHRSRSQRPGVCVASSRVEYERRWFALKFENPSGDDGAHLWRLARDSGGLDLNSPYTYLMLSRFFRKTCAVARDGKHVGGFIAGFRQPSEPGTLFVWQITVDPALRQRRVGRRMLAWLLAQLTGEGVSHLEASVTPSNEASRRMFVGLARELGAPCSESPLFRRNAFPPGGSHEDEILLRIGPFDEQQVAEAARSLESPAQL